MAEELSSKPVTAPQKGHWKSSYIIIETFAFGFPRVLSSAPIGAKVVVVTGIPLFRSFFDTENLLPFNKIAPAIRNPTIIIALTICFWLLFCMLL